MALGLRQGELLGLTWEDIDLEVGTLRVRRGLKRYDGAYHLDDPKTERSRRVLSLPAPLVPALRAHRDRQQFERQTAGASWRGNDWNLVFTRPNGRPLHSTTVTKQFKKRLRSAGLPQVRFTTCATGRRLTCSVRDRLELKGFTYEAAEADFKRELEADIQRYEGYLKDGKFSGVSHLIEDDLRIRRSLTIESWLEALARIKEERLTKDTLGGMLESDSQLPLLRYMLDSRWAFLGFPGVDRRHVVRIALETASPQEHLAYDLSDLVAAGWMGEADDVVAIAEHLMNQDFLLSQRVIVLTEGDSDRRILERSLRLLYPHLVEHFHFFDFSGRKVGAGLESLPTLFERSPQRTFDSPSLPFSITTLLLERRSAISIQTAFPATSRYATIQDSLLLATIPQLVRRAALGWMSTD